MLWYIVHSGTLVQCSALSDDSALDMNQAFTHCSVPPREEISMDRLRQVRKKILR